MSLLLHVMAGANYASRPAEFSAICARVTPFHQHSPLVHCMTNDVVQTFTANTLLALGASPAMVIETEEASQFAAIASALLINVGTLTQPRAQAMSAAVEQATRSQTPRTLDPVAVGALDYRRRFVWNFCPISQPPYVVMLRKSWH